MSGVFETQLADTLCKECKALANSFRDVRNNLNRIKNEQDGTLHTMPKEVKSLYEEAITRIGLLRTPGKTEGQKTAGNCKMPKGVCFVKSSKGILKSLP